MAIYWGRIYRLKYVIVLYGKIINIGAKCPSSFYTFYVDGGLGDTWE